jgi:uncharacterized protein YqgV (UPF0045/DUF77 family)
LDENRIVNIGIQVLPLTEDAIPLVDRAIAAIAASGLRYEVGPLGVLHVVTVIKIADGAHGAHTIDEKTAKYR